jgi:NAD(P)H-hydrate epimerase
MTGSADLASAAALRAGSGYVRRSTPGLDPARLGTVPTGPIEAVTTALDAEDWADDVLGDIDRFGALAIGPGLGREPSVRAQLARVLAVPIPIVIDGDGLRALGDDAAALLRDRPADAPGVVLTPHDAEFAALGGDADAPDRFEAVREVAARTGAVVLRKGPITIVAHPDGDVLVSTAGDARLATAGTGDVLTGVLGAFLARGVDPFEAAAAAAWVHGAAGRLGRPTGLVASDLPDLVASVLAELLAAPDDVEMSEDGLLRTDPTRCV